MRVLYTEITRNFFHSFFRLVLLPVFFFLFVNNSNAQAPGMLEFSGRAVKDGKPLPGAVVTVYRGGTIEQQKVKVGKNGKFSVNLVFGVDYKITFSYPGCVDMYLMVYTGKLPKERNDIYPLYETEIPFFETTTNAVRVEKYKNPFTKIIYDGKKAFMDDEAYLAQFTKDILIDPNEQAKLMAEKLAKEKAEKDKLEAAEKAKKDAEEKARKDAEEKLLAEQKAKEDAIAKANELARLKEESERQKLHVEEETMETEAIRLQHEKEAKGVLAKKNKEIKTNYENDLLKMVAENERNAKQKALNQQKWDARSNTVINQMRKETELKAEADKLRQEQKLKQKKTLENKQYKINQMRKLVEAAAFAERSVRISNQKTLPDVNGYLRKELPNVAVTVDDGIIKTVRTTTVTQGRQLDIYRKETYFWSSVYCYKNNIQIDEATYNKEISFYAGYQTKQ
jgi:hypothetical protein